jgi:hypothetical protein
MGNEPRSLGCGHSATQRAVEYLGEFTVMSHAYKHLGKNSAGLWGWGLGEERRAVLLASPVPSPQSPVPFITQIFCLTAYKPRTFADRSKTMKIKSIEDWL